MKNKQEYIMLIYHHLHVFFVNASLNQSLIWNDINSCLSFTRYVSIRVPFFLVCVSFIVE